MDKCLDKFTIIIPHKNIPSLLERCLNSIPIRKDLNIIIVDDNSDPNIVDFANFPGKEREDVKIFFTKEGKGAGFARNIALKTIKDPTWVLFADADDFFTQKFNFFLDKYKNSVADVIYIANDRRDSDNPTIQYFSEGDSVVLELYKQSQQYSSQDPLRYKCNPPWTKMVRSDLIKLNEICFDETIASNDVWFSVQVGHYAKIIEVETDSIYVWTKREGSLVHIWNEEVLTSRILVGIRVNHFLYSIGKHNCRTYIWCFISSLRRCSYKVFYKMFFLYILNTPIKILFDDMSDLLKQKFSKQ